MLTGLPAAVGTAALWLQVPVWIVFVARRLHLWRRGHRNPVLPWLVVVPALNWHLGIVVFDDDRIFTLTNVFLHGVPYLALVWVAGGRQRVQGALARVRIRGSAAAVVAAFYGLLLALELVGAETPLYRAYCKFWRHRQERKRRVRRRVGFHHGLLGLK